MLYHLFDCFILIFCSRSIYCDASPSDVDLREGSLITGKVLSKKAPPNVVGKLDKDSKTISDDQTAFRSNYTKFLGELFCKVPHFDVLIASNAPIKLKTGENLEATASHLIADFVFSEVFGGRCDIKYQPYIWPSVARKSKKQPEDTNLEDGDGPEQDGDEDNLLSGKRGDVKVVTVEGSSHIVLFLQFFALLTNAQ